MDDSIIIDKPKIHAQVVSKSKEIGFSMPSDLYVGSLLKTLISSKSNANILELGTGIGLSLSWMLDGMDAQSKITTVDNDANLVAIAAHFFKQDNRVQIVCEDGSKFIENYTGEPFDLIFADAWPGKYSEIEEVLNLLKIGGFYIIDDMQHQPNWPDGHQDLVDSLIEYLEKRNDFNVTKLNWSTGIIIAVRIK